MICPDINDYPAKENNLKYLEDLFTKDYQKYSNLICLNNPLRKKLGELFPFYKNRFSWAKNLFYFKSNQIYTQDYYEIFSSILDGLDLTTNKEMDKYKELNSIFIEPFGSYKLVPENYTFEYKEEFSQIDLYSFLSSEQKVNELNFNLNEMGKEIKKMGLFGGIGKQSLGQGIVLLLMNECLEFSSNNDEITNNLALGLIGFSILRYISAIKFPQFDYDYNLLLRKSIRADTFIEEYSKMIRERER